MGWAQDLVKLYDNCLGNPNIPDSGDMTPLGWKVFKAYIEITIDEDGNFKDARKLEGEPTRIPVSGISSKRTGKRLCAHPLADHVKYCAGDLPDYLKSAGKHFDVYLQGLQSWASSSFSHPKVRAVCKYIEKKSLIKDLAWANALKMSLGKDGILRGADSEGVIRTLDEMDKTSRDAYLGQLIRWVVISETETDFTTWNDADLHKKWFDYTQSLKNPENIGKYGFCYVLGKVPLNNLSTDYPKGMHPLSNNSKVMSANDTSEFTYIGQIFTSNEQAVTVSSEALQKMALACSWLKSRKNYVVSNDKTAYLMGQESATQPGGDFVNSLSFLNDKEPDQPYVGDAGSAFIAQLRQKIKGRKASIKESDNIVVLGLYATSKGRTSVIYYQKFSGSDFYANIERWHQNCAWHLTSPTGKEYIGVPPTWEILNTAYPLNKDQMVVQTLIPCIMEGRPIPQNLVNQLVQRAFRPEIFKNNNDRYQCLGIACAMYKGAHPEEGYKMELEPNKTSRDYLFGRLWAIADKLESHALFIKGEDRPTNADRLMCAARPKPWGTWQMLENRISPYIRYLKARRPGLATWYMNMLDEVYGLMGPDMQSDKPLDGEFLIGYHCQRNWFKQNKENSNEQVD